MPYDWVKDESVWDKAANKYAGILLTPQEASVMEQLLRAYPHAATIEALVSAVSWGAKITTDSSTPLVRVYISRLRKKIGHIFTIEHNHGAGYGLVPREAYVCPTCHGFGLIADDRPA